MLFLLAALEVLIYAETVVLYHAYAPMTLRMSDCTACWIPKKK